MLKYLKVPAHSMRFTGSGLSVREARGHAALEYGRHERLRRVSGTLHTNYVI